MDLYIIRKQLNMGIPLTNIKLKVTDYARVSTDNIRQKKSLQNQIEHFDKYIKDNPNWTYIPGYVDDGITGTSDIKRDNFMKMINDARNGKFDLIITKEISRFSRNTLDSIKYTRDLLSYGVAVLFINDNINTALPDSELRLTIMASMAQDEIRRLSERVKFGMSRAIERGEILGNDMLYGYKKDRSKNVLNIVFDEAKIVKKIYELYAINQLSLSKIASFLNKENYPSCQGKKWSAVSISRMIENPKYKGFYCGKKSEVVDYMTKKIKYFTKDNWVMYKDKIKIPPIVSENLWERANKRLISRKKSNNLKNKEIKNKYLYSSKIYCGKHNKPFYRRIVRRNKLDNTWICSEYLKNGKQACDLPNIRQSELTAIFKDLISILNINTKDVINVLMSYYKKEISDELEYNINNLLNEKNKIIGKKKKILDYNLQGNISNNEFCEQNKLLNIDLLKINSLINESKNNVIDFNDKYKKILKSIKIKLESPIILDKIISFLLDHIVVLKNTDNSIINLNIYLLYNNKKDNNPFFIKDYEFKRGYDVEKTKKYIIKYKVNYYFNFK